MRRRCERTMIDVALYCILGGVVGFLFVSIFQGMPISIKVVFSFIGAVIGGYMARYHKRQKEEQENLEKKKKMEDALHGYENALYNEWCEKLNRCYNSIAKEIYCNCNRAVSYTHLTLPTKLEV